MKVSRLKRCPSRLESLLKAVRIIPPTVPLLPFDDALAFVCSHSPGDDPFTREAKALNFCLELLKKSGSPVSDFLDYVWGLPDSNHQDPITATEAAIDRYEDFRLVREKLASLAKISQFPVDKRRGMRQLLRSLDIEIDEHGEVQPRENWFIKALNGVNEVWRIRECQVCAQVFWAGRIGVQGCSPRCLDILRKRNKRKHDAKKKAETTEQRARPLTETEKRDLVGRALESGDLSQSQIVQKTKLTADEVADVLAHLILKSGEVRSEERDETRVYFLNVSKPQAKANEIQRRRR